MVLVLEGLVVVCLKGGDFFLFGCGGEEMLVCCEVGVEVEVVFGVSVVLVVVVGVGVFLIYWGLV